MQWWPTTNTVKKHTHRGSGYCRGLALSRPAPSGVSQGDKGEPDMGHADNNITYKSSGFCSLFSANTQFCPRVNKNSTASNVIILMSLLLFRNLEKCIFDTSGSYWLYTSFPQQQRESIRLHFNRRKTYGEV